MEFWGLVARESIRDLVARYNANGDAGRIQEVLRLFTDDAVLEVASDQRYVGTDAIRGLFQGAMDDGGVRVLRHFTATHQIDVLSQSEARGRCYYAVFTEHGLDHHGRYLDEYTCAGGVWRFQTRRVTVDARTPGGWAERRMRPQRS